MFIDVDVAVRRFVTKQGRGGGGENTDFVECALSSYFNDAYTPKKENISTFAHRCYRLCLSAQRTWTPSVRSKLDFQILHPLQWRGPLEWLYLASPCYLFGAPPLALLPCPTTWSERTARLSIISHMALVFLRRSPSTAMSYN